MVLGITIKALHIMKFTNKNRAYYHEVLMTPCYLMRSKLEEDYAHIMEFGLNTLGIIEMVAEHLTAYNELTGCGIFFRMRDFEVTI